MADYISRQRILNYIDDEYCMHCEHSDGVRCENCHYEDVRIAIKSMPAADVQPVKHGHWSECYTDTHHYSGICSVCGKASIKSLTEKLYNYCPKCGARMDGEQE